MPVRILDKSPAALELLRSRRVAVLGYGNQGRAHALNLRDSGASVAVGQRPGSSFERAREDGFGVVPVAEAVEGADLLILGLPDEAAAEVYAREIQPALRAGQALGFIHGFNIRYGLIQPAEFIDVVLVAPKGPGSLLRSLFEKGQGLPALLAVHRNASGAAHHLALGWAMGIGSSRAAVVETSFAIETETDLFGEQAVLCGGMSALAQAAFDTLIEAGYEPEFAYLECVHELKQVVDLLYERGLSGMRQRVSNTAEYGDLSRGARVVGPEARAVMRRILEEIQSGHFAREWMDEHRAGRWRERAAEERPVSPLFENAGNTIRSWMPWLRA